MQWAFFFCGMKNLELTLNHFDRKKQYLERRGAKLSFQKTSSQESFLKTEITEARRKFETQTKLVMKFETQNKLQMQSNSNCRYFFRLYNNVLCASKNNDMLEKNITVDELNNFSANVGRKLARKTKNSNWFKVRDEIKSVFLLDIKEKNIK